MKDNGTVSNTLKLLPNGNTNLVRQVPKGDGQRTLSIISHSCKSQLSSGSIMQTHTLYISCGKPCGRHFLGRMNSIIWMRRLKTAGIQRNIYVMPEMARPSRTKKSLLETLSRTPCFFCSGRVLPRPKQDLLGTLIPAPCFFVVVVVVRT